MRASDLERDISSLLECELVRFIKKDDEFILYVVGDDEYTPLVNKTSIIPSNNNEEDSSSDCCEGLNGHLFSLHFLNVSDLKIKGEECDNYKTLKAEYKDGVYALEFEGHNLYEKDNDVFISFKASEVNALDEGKITSPEI